MSPGIFRPMCRLCGRRFFHTVIRVLAAGWLGMWTVHGADFVVQISVDGLGASYLQNLIDLGDAPNFARFQTEGAWTNNARTDFDYTITLPNHTGMLTGRPVLDTAAAPSGGHLYTDNGEPGPVTLHANRGFYVQSAFDVVHDHGLSTSLYATKSKFVLYDQSYNGVAGAPDLIGADNGRDKIDVYVNPNGDSGAMTASFLANLASSPTNYSFVHFFDPDNAGHSTFWGSAEYYAAIKTVDGYLGSLFNLINTNPLLQGRTAVILSADHGGSGDTHVNPLEPLDYTIPFYVWGAGVTAGAELYSLNAGTRLDPGSGRPDYSVATAQPIRNADGGNLALDLLGLGPIEGSSINANQSLAVPEAGTNLLILAGCVVLAGCGRLGRVERK